MTGDIVEAGRNPYLMQMPAVFADMPRAWGISKALTRGTRKPKRRAGPGCGCAGALPCRPVPGVVPHEEHGRCCQVMQEQGMPPLEGGVRNTGERAMLAMPRDACGAYVGFVGRE